MQNKPLKIAFTGVFDIANYGDHLFPMIFTAVMKAKKINIELYLFSPFGGKQSLSINEDVYPLTKMESLHLEHNFDAIIVGGGGILHYASGKQKLFRESEDFLDYPVYESWVIPSLVAYKHDIKLIWNLPGGHLDFKDFYQDLTQMLCVPVNYMSVRDNYTKNILLDCGFENDSIKVYPDSAFVMKRYISDEILNTLISGLFEDNKKYIVFHANRLLSESSIPDVVKTLDYFMEIGYKIVLLPLAYTHDDESIFRKINSQAKNSYFMFEKELSMYEIMSVLAKCHMSIGVSFHGAITAVCHGNKAVAFDYVMNGKTKDLFSMLKLEDYYVNNSSKLLEKAMLCEEKMNSINIEEKEDILDEHFNSIANLLINDNKIKKDGDIFLEKLSSSIMRMNESQNQLKTKSYEYALLKAQFDQLDRLRHEMHMKYAFLEK